MHCSVVKFKISEAKTLYCKNSFLPMRHTHLTVSCSLVPRPSKKRTVVESPGVDGSLKEIVSNFE